MELSFANVDEKEEFFAFTFENTVNFDVLF